MVLVIPAVLCIAMAPALRAQAPGDVQGLDPSVRETPPAHADAEVIVADQLSLLTLLQSGGWAMWPLGLFSVAVFALALHNVLSLRTSQFCPPGLVGDLRRLMEEVKIRDAFELAKASPTYLGRMLSRSLPSIDSADPETLGREKFQEAMGDFSLRTNGRYMLWVNYFSILAQASPMLGLLGTVSGMIKAFSTMGREGMGDPTLLAGHISEALVTTACGLIIALPALFCYFVFRNRLTQLISQCVDIADELLDASLAAVNPDHHGVGLPNGIERTEA